MNTKAIKLLITNICYEALLSRKMGDLDVEVTNVSDLIIQVRIKDDNMPRYFNVQISEKM